MQDTTLSPFCVKQTALSTSYQDCGQYLHAMELASSQARAEGRCYEIIPEGEQFAIAFRGVIEVHGLSSDDLPKAQEVLAILNSVIEAEEPRCH
jgi:hypothetical protein